MARHPHNHKKSKGKKSSRNHHRTSNNSNKSASNMKPSWVDRLAFEPIKGNENSTQDEGENHDNNEQKTKEISLSIICWNVLAESYCSRNSHPGLPKQYQEVVFQPERRGSLIRKILCGPYSYVYKRKNGEKVTKTATTNNDTTTVNDTTTTENDEDDAGDGDDDTDDDHDSQTPSPMQPLRPDIWALQEVDMDEIQSNYLTSMGYEGLETPRMKMGAGAGGKADSCGLYYLKDKWDLVDSKTIALDDLASLSSSDGKIDSINNNLRGLQQSFLRRNVGLLVRLQHCHDNDVTVVILVTHLFWNPRYEYVKLCQMHYLLLLAKQFRLNEQEPFVVCGDFNSLPGSSVQRYLAQGTVNARLVAPWYCCGRYGTNSNNNNEEEENENEKDTVESVSNELDSLAVNDEEDPVTTPVYIGSKSNSAPQVKYLLDYTLNRLCRWFRILGLDAGLETADEEKQRTRDANMVVFERCRDEGRVLVTTSNTLLARTNCPAGTYMVRPKSLASNWEIVLVHILLTHGVVLDPTQFLTRCVFCNGIIQSVTDPALKRKIFADHQAPANETDALAVYQCDGCNQGYWWNDRPESSSSRVKDQATRLFQLCLQAGVSVAQTGRHMFEHVNVSEEREKGWDWTMKGSELLKLKLQVSEWLKDGQLKCPVQKLQSAYKDDASETGEILPYTNVTRDFEGCLDYIFYSTDSLAATDLLYVPKSYEELNGTAPQLSNGHLLPSDVWPSDHLAIGAKLVLRRGKT